MKEKQKPFLSLQIFIKNQSYISNSYFKDILVSQFYKIKVSKEIWQVLIFFDLWWGYGPTNPLQIENIIKSETHL